jgi:hypothetical protein
MYNYILPSLRKPQSRRTLPDTFPKFRMALDLARFALGLNLLIVPTNAFGQAANSRRCAFAAFFALFSRLARL